MLKVHSPLQAQLVEWLVEVGDAVREGDVLVVLESMKMEHEVRAPAAGVVRERLFAVGESVVEKDVLLALAPATALASAAGLAPADGSNAAGFAPGDASNAAGFAPGGAATPVPPAISGAAADGAHASVPQARVAKRNDLQRVLDRHALTEDTARPDAVAKRQALGLRTARENIADLCDEGSFTEYGALAVAAQRSRRSEDDLQRNTPADGMVTGIGSVDGQRTAILAYDATVLAGTQGFRNHQKTDRLLGIALKNKLPVVLFAEGGGGRPGDTDMPIVAGLHVPTFASFARLNGQVPVVGVVAGRCFAGNAALLGCCDVIVATKDSNIGMGGPAMVEGGGLGVFKPEEIGPSGVQHANGVIDVLVQDEAEAVAVARKYLGYFRAPGNAFDAPDAAKLRDVVPENRLRVYDSRAAVEGLFDTGSILWLRTGFGIGIHTALARLAGRAVGVMANNPLHLGGAIDADASDKAARFMQLCNAHGLPIVSLVDTPGFMVGPSIEAQAQVRHVSRMFIAAAHLQVPLFGVVLRKGYGLGAMAMVAGGFHAPDFTVAWPSGEFGGMGLEGAVRLGYRKELEAVPEGAERDALFEKLVAQKYEEGQALNMAATLEIDAVIDPAQTREWLVRGLASSAMAPSAPRMIDSW